VPAFIEVRGGKTWDYTAAEFEGNIFRIPLHQGAILMHRTMSSRR
jgi:hypothetical protein